jgi:hypothetical protein
MDAISKQNYNFQAIQRCFWLILPPVYAEPCICFFRTGRIALPVSAFCMALRNPGNN